jgi:hypothetical protein
MTRVLIMSSAIRRVCLAALGCLVASAALLVDAQSCGFMSMDFSSFANEDMQGTDSGLNYQYYLRGTRIDAALAGHTSTQDAAAAAAACGNEALR